jgi:bifunctional non-homologous end joining protein LigD
VTAAKLLRDVRKTLGLASWVKTTGGHGLHVVVPVRPARDWSECLAFARTVSVAIARSDPGLYTTTFAKVGREDKLLIDYLRNNRTNTSISAFSPRARPGAHVSMPLAWRDLADGPARWTLLTVPRKLKRIRTDPWEDYWSTKQRLSATAMRALQRL